MTRLLRRLPLLLAALFMAACSSLSGLLPFTGPPTTAVRSVRIQALVDANRNVPTRLDLVFIYDKDVPALLPKSGVEWFQQKEALLAANPKKLEVASFELPPASVVDPAPLPERYRKALGVLAYADYLAGAGQAVANLTPFKHPLIRLEAESFAIEEQP